MFADHRLESAELATIIRTSIIGETPRKISLLEWAKSHRGKDIHGYTNHQWNGMTCLQLVKIIHWMIRNEAWSNYVYHFFSPEKISKYELLELINEIYELSLEIEPVKTLWYIDKTLAYHQPFYSDISRNIPPLKQQLKELREFSSKILDGL